MILLDVKRYIQTHQRVSLSDLQNRFDLSKEAAEGLLDPLIRQGHVLPIQGHTCTRGRCSSCSTGQTSEHYIWREKCYPHSIPIKVQVI
jgi:hypothetical protein